MSSRLQSHVRFSHDGHELIPCIPTMTCRSAGIAANEGVTDTHSVGLLQGCGSILVETKHLDEPLTVTPCPTTPAVISSARSACAAKAPRSDRQIVVRPDHLAMAGKKAVITMEDKREGACSPPHCRTVAQLEATTSFCPAEIVNAGTCNGETSAHACDLMVLISLSGK